MEGWIKWLGELVWRMCKLPGGVRGKRAEENFWFRMYGVLTLLVSMGAGMFVLKWRVDTLSQMLVMLNNYTGADKILAQGYIGAGLVIVLAAPIVLCAVVVLATIVTIIPGLALLGSRIALWASVQWAKRFKAKEKAVTELSPETREAFLFLLLGLVAGFILWLAIKTGTTTDGDTPVAVQPPAEPSTDAEAKSDGTATPAV